MRFICSDLTPTWRLPTALARQMLSTATSPITASSLRRYHQQSESCFRQHVCLLAGIGRASNCNVRCYFPRNPLDIVPTIAPLMLAVSATLLDEEPNSVTTSCLCCANVGRRRSPMTDFELLETSASIHPSASR